MSVCVSGKGSLIAQRAGLHRLVSKDVTQVE